MNVLAVVTLARLGRRLLGTAHELTNTRAATVERAASADRSRSARIVPVADASREAMLAPQEGAVVLQQFATAEHMEARGEIRGAIDRAETPGTRAPVDACELKLELEA